MKYLYFTEDLMRAELPTITKTIAKHSKGSAKDYYSNGDYWWPNPDTEDGLPYVRRDGDSNPSNFNDHRFILRQMVNDIVTLYIEYGKKGEKRFSERIEAIIRSFFLDENTGMNPSLDYGQAIPGVCDGRGIGIVDTVHLVDIPYIVEDLHKRNALSEDVFDGIRKWFADYAEWLQTSQLGIDESVHPNNHSICYYMQLASYTYLSDNRREVYEKIVKVLKERIIPLQMEEDGSLPRELARTKPYNYSLFALDILTTLVVMLSKEIPEVLDIEVDGKNIRKALLFMLPYVEDKSKWPYGVDFENFDNLPVKMAFMYFGFTKFGIKEYENVWNKLGYADTVFSESARNCSSKYPEIY